MSPDSHFMIPLSRFRSLVIMYLARFILSEAGMYHELGFTRIQIVPSFLGDLQIFRGGLIKLVRRASKDPFSSIDEDQDQGWQGRFVLVRTSDLISAEFRSFPKKWNASRNYNFLLNVDFMFISLFLIGIRGSAAIARVPNAIPRFKEWIEGIISHIPYSERSWRKLSKGRWEAHSHGLPKTVELRPPVRDEDLPADSSASGQPRATIGEKKRRKALSSPSLEKKKPRRRLVRKPKESSSSRVTDSNSLFRLRDEPEEDELFVAHEPSVSEERMAVEGEIMEVNLRDLLRLRLYPAPPDVKDILGSPSFTESMFDEVRATKERSN
nr:uncharacterized protein LOC117276455 [Nicotiana tomentosiformis]